MDLSPFDKRLIQSVRTIQSEMVGTVPTSAISERLRLPRRTTRHYLSRLVQKSALHRPHGPRGGYSATPSARWLAMREDVRWKLEKLDNLDRDILNSLRSVMHSGAIAEAIELPARTARYRLKKLETLALVHRPDGPRSGWMRTDEGNRILTIILAKDALVNLKPFDVRILETVQTFAGRRSTVCSTAIAEFLDTPPRTMRHYLSRLDKRGLLDRPDGVKSGYRLSDVGREVVKQWRD